MTEAPLLLPSGSTYKWRQVRARVLHRDRHACQLRIKCDGARATHVDHVIARWRWPAGTPGVDAPENLQASCAPCNLAKGRGLSLREWSW